MERVDEHMIKTRGNHKLKLEDAEVCSEHEFLGKAPGHRCKCRLVSLSQSVAMPCEKVVIEPGRLMYRMGVRGG